jgi:hypothetical protein
MWVAVFLCFLRDVAGGRGGFFMGLFYCFVEQRPIFVEQPVVFVEHLLFFEGQPLVFVEQLLNFVGPTPETRTFTMKTSLPNEF